MSIGSDADELLLQYVQEALSSKASGGTTVLYDQLVAEVKRLKAALRAKPAPDAHPAAQPESGATIELSALLRALGACVSMLHERRHEILLRELLDTPLWSVPQRLRLVVLDLVTHLVVANGALVQSCLQTLVYSMLPPPGPPQPDPCPGEPWQPAANDALIQDEVVAATEKVLNLVPTASVRLLPLLVGNFPHKLRDRNTQCLYMRAAFSLAESAAGAGVREAVLAGAMEHLISIDVDIRWEDIAEAAAEEAREEEGGLPPQEEPDIFELEGMSALDLATHDGSSGDDVVGSPPPAARGGWEGGHALKQPAAPAVPDGEAQPDGKPPVDETADKLDSMMELTLGHLQRRTAAGELPAAWATLLAAFERCVLLTHRSKFTQFLLFFACRQSPEPCCRALLQLLIGRLTDRQQPPIARSACAAYAASFLARAAYCPEALVVESLQRIADWCLRYARDEDRRGGLPPIPSSNTFAMLSADAQVRHSAFYAAVQAVLYVLCYHMEPLLRAPKHRPQHQQQQDGAENDAAAHANGHAARLAHGVTGSLGGTPNGGTPTSLDTPTGMRAHDRREASQREACADAVRQLFAGPMPRLLQHSLDPLSSCARSVVTEFGRQARAQGFAELARIVRDWERRHAAAGSAKPQRQLELFFPFDPYLLRRSAAALELESTYVRWRRGHPAGAVRADLESSSSSDSEGEEEGSEMSDEEEAAATGGQALSDVDVEGSDSDEDSASSDSSSSSAFDSSSDSDTDDLKRTRFGSVPGSSLGSDHRARKRPHLPSGLKAPLVFGAPAASPTLGFAVPGSLSSGGSPPFGLSPAGVAPFGGTPLPAFGGAAPAGGLHLGLNGRT